MPFAHTSPVSFKNMSFFIEIRSFQQPASYLWGLDPKSFCISLAFNMITNDARFVSRIWDVIVLDLFGRVSGDVNEKRWGSSGFRFVVSTSCLAPSVFYVV